MDRTLTTAELSTIDTAILAARGNGDVHDPAVLLYDTVATIPVIEAWLAGHGTDLPMALTTAILVSRGLADEKRDDCDGVIIMAAAAAADAALALR